MYNFWQRPEAWFCFMYLKAFGSYFSSSTSYISLYITWAPSPSFDIEIYVYIYIYIFQIFYASSVPSTISRNKSSFCCFINVFQSLEEYLWHLDFRGGIVKILMTKYDVFKYI